MQFLIIILVAIVLASSDILAIQSKTSLPKSKHIEDIQGILSDHRVAASIDDPILEKARSLTNEEVRVVDWNYRFAVLFRALYLIFAYFPVIFSGMLAYISGSFRNSLWFPYLRWTIANSGAAFIKWGQWASTRGDMFPEALCEQLSMLQSDAPKHSYFYTKKQIMKELGKPIEDIFDYFERDPLASGSIAQVYRAVLNKNVVAVKVRHPGVKQQIEMDFDIMTFVASFIDSLPGLDWLNLSESMSQFSATIASQTRLDIEGDNLLLFNRNFRKWKEYNFPKPIIMTQSVLIETFLEGESVAVIIENVKKNPKKYPELSHFIVTRGEDLYLKMLLQDNLMHADLHPGNILIKSTLPDSPLNKKQGVKENIEIEKYLKLDQLSGGSIADLEFKIALVDAGMVARLTFDERQNFIGLIETIGEGKGREAADYVLGFSSKTRENRQNYEPFRHDMDLLFRKVARGYGTNVDLGEVLRGVLTLVRKHRVTIEANYATLVVNALCLDSLAKKLSPTYNVIEGAKVLLRLNRRCKKLPNFVSNLALKTFLPFIQRMKKGMDRKFLRNLLKNN